MYVLQSSTVGRMNCKCGPHMYKSVDCRYPENPFTLETQHIRKNYKFLKREMSADLLLDHLVEHNLLDTDENTFLLDKCRAVKCDFILRKLLRHPERLQDFIKLITSEEWEFECFRTLRNFPPSFMRSQIVNKFIVRGELYCFCYNFLSAYSLNRYITERNFKISFHNFLTYTSFFIWFVWYSWKVFHLQGYYI
jgi:hypothetical protein